MKYINQILNFGLILLKYSKSSFTICLPVIKMCYFDLGVFKSKTQSLFGLPICYCLGHKIDQL